MLEFLMYQASDDAASEPNTLLLIAQIVTAFLSIPIIATVLTAVGRVLLPSSRLRNRITRDLAIYEKLPESATKTALGQQIEGLVDSLIARTAPSTQAANRAKVKRVALVILGIGIVVAGVVFLFLGFRFDLANSIVSTIVSVLGGALTLVVGAFASRAQKSSEESFTNIVSTLSEARQAERDAMQKERERADLNERRLERAEDLLRQNNIELPED